MFKYKVNYTKLMKTVTIKANYIQTFINYINWLTECLLTLALQKKSPEGFPATQHKNRISSQINQNKHIALNILIVLKLLFFYKIQLKFFFFILFFTSVTVSYFTNL